MFYHEMGIQHRCSRFIQTARLSTRDILISQYSERSRIFNEITSQFHFERNIRLFVFEKKKYIQIEILYISIKRKYVFKKLPAVTFFFKYFLLHNTI